jgi:hypothetical protein
MCGRGALRSRRRIPFTTAWRGCFPRTRDGVRRWFGDVTSNTYYDWFIDRAYIMYGAQAGTAEFLETFREFPPSRRPASFTIDQAMEALKRPSGG